MQHDTSPHRLELDGKADAARCAALVLAYSRRLFVQYSPAFTRFEAKHFLLEAVRFMDGSVEYQRHGYCRYRLRCHDGYRHGGLCGDLGFFFTRSRVSDIPIGRIERPFSYI
jgi:hypothetical protein